MSITSPVASVAAEVWAGLSRTPPELSPKFFYDEVGSALFDEITRLPEYYPTRTELAILADAGPAIVAQLKPTALVDIGGGSGEKTRIFLRAMARSGIAHRYVAVDASETFLAKNLAAVGQEVPGLQVSSIAADIVAGFALPADVPSPAVFLFLGSTLGNFEEPDASALLARIREAMRPGDSIVVGVDLRKDIETVEQAYNDAAGVTAKFNLNILRSVNAAVGTDFDTDMFEHRAFYDTRTHQIEMHLIARQPQAVRVPGCGLLVLKAGQSIRTEISRKFARAEVESLLRSAGLVPSDWFFHKTPSYGVAVAALGHA